jgi:undecaprenyl-phosphate 4-deoxy-4-formamido-L-arabinose transferase
MPDAPISIVVPVYHSAPILPDLVARIEAALRPSCPDMELILVNDGSKDGSWDAIRKASEGRPWVRGLDLMRNFGQHNALLCGIRAARNPVVVTMDDDLQHPPEEVPKLLALLAQGHDVVYGTPAAETHGAMRDSASVMTKMAMRAAMGIDVARDVCAFRAFRTELRRAFDGYSAPYVCIDVLLSWATTRFAAVPVRHDARAKGASTYTFRKLVRHTMNMLTGYSILPLRIASITGFAFTLFGIGVLIYVVGRYLVIQGSPTPGFPFLASIIAIFSGVQLFALGVIGEYVGRTHFHVMGRPTYAVRGSTDAATRSPSGGGAA